jgi:hypothetical protein
VRTLEFSGRLLGLPPDTPRRDGPARHDIYHFLRVFLLCKNAVRIKVRGGHLLAVYAVLFQRANYAQPRGLCQQHHHEDPIEQ